jgi:hypothetical protein
MCVCIYREKGAAGIVRVCIGSHRVFLSGAMRFLCGLYKLIRLFQVSERCPVSTILCMSVWARGSIGLVVGVLSVFDPGSTYPYSSKKGLESPMAFSNENT